MLNAVELSELKAAQRRLVRRAGGQEACVLVPGMRLKRHQAFNEFGHPDLPDRHMPVDVLATLERDAGVEVTAVLAALTGHLLVPLPEAAGGNTLGRLTAEALRDTARVFSNLGDMLADGRLSAKEAEHLGREIDKALTRLAALKLQAEAEAEAEERPCRWR